MLKSEITQPQKVTTSFTAEVSTGVAFGDRPIHISPIDGVSRAAEYNAEIAYLMAVVSAWAYADEKALAAKLRYYGLPGAHIRRITVQNNALLVVTTAYLIQSESGRTAILAFRGTDPGNPITMLTDGQVMQLPFFDTKVHAGFYTSVEVVWDEVDTALRAAKNAQYIGADDQRATLPNALESLYITGHSLGGAMAVLAAARLFRRDYEALDPRKLVKGVYTFGQPMVGDAAFANSCRDEFGDRLFRHVYHNDFVPHLPPKSQLEYAHTGGERRSPSLTTAWSYQERASESGHLGVVVSQVFINALEARTAQKDIIPGYSIDDHMPENYLQVCRTTLDPAAAPAVPQRSWLPRVTESTLEALKAVRTTIEGATRGHKA